MARSTQAQKAKILNAAYRLLSRQMSTAQAAAVLSRQRAISLRQAYRYLEQAAQLDGPVMVAEPALPITFKIPALRVLEWVNFDVFKAPAACK